MPLIKAIKYLILQCNKISCGNAPTKDGGLYIEYTLTKDGGLILNTPLSNT